MSLLIPGGKVIIFNFPAGAGGKMLQNCVGLSRHCVLKHPDYATWQLQQTSTDQSFYQQKLKWILQTVPAQLEHNQWLRYELRDDHMYGLDFVGFAALQPMQTSTAIDVASAGLWTTITSHNSEGSKYYYKYWPTIKQVSLVNSAGFAQRFLSIKNPHIKFDTDWEKFGRDDPKHCYNFDVDSTIYKTDLFCQQVEDLYNYLEFDDFSADLIWQYHQTYIKIHQ